MGNGVVNKSGGFDVEQGRQAMNRSERILYFNGWSLGWDILLPMNVLSNGRTQMDHSLHL